MTTKQAKVAILMCTMNGETYLPMQLQSFVDQSENDWHLYISDDGSTDRTLDILKEFQMLYPEQVTLFNGPRKGFAENFLTLVCKENIRAEYYAYSDHDDIWKPQKLARAIKWLETIPKEKPALYGARTELVDSEGKHIGLSMFFQKQKSFANALVQNVASGNTMVFNNASRTLLCAAGSGLSVPCHDWWTYIVVTGAGGEVFIDPIPVLDYRQHGHNLIGAGHGWLARFNRIKKMLGGQMQKWNSAHITALLKLEEHLTPTNRKILNIFSVARMRNPILRVLYLKRSGIYRQTFLGNLGLIIAAFLGKI